MKIDKEANELGDLLNDQDFDVKILLDKDGKPILTYAWYKEIIVTKLNISDSSSMDKK